MGTVTTSLRQEAQSIFTDLGYNVSGNGGEIRAERKWRTVRVTPMSEPRDIPQSGDLRCFVTWEDRAGDLEHRLTREDPDYEWAIIGVREGGEWAVAGRTA
jgi:hypothetical protein